jgi:CubicO group peptidase (beta-lactamase class C family)
VACLGFIIVTWAATSGAAGPPDPEAGAPDVKVWDVSGVLDPELISPPGNLRTERRALRKASTVEEAIDICVLNEMAWFDAPGAAVAVVLDGGPLYERGYGERLRGSSQPVNPGTIFRIGPVTQQMTAATVMQQVELGRVALTDPITDLIPEFEVSGRWPAERITVWNTLTHTTGFPDVLESGGVQTENSLSMWARRQDDMTLYAPPGSFWNYSNPGFMIAGLIAERASGVNYRRLMKQDLWEPAGMVSTTFDPAEVVATGNYSYGHCWVCSIGGEVVVPPEENDLWDVGPAGMAFSTVRDLARWAVLLMDGGGPVLSSRSAVSMQANQQWIHLKPDQFTGFGIMSEDYRGLDVRYHPGSIRGYGSCLLWVPKRRFAVALLANATSELTSAAHCIVDAVLDPDEVEQPDLTTDPSTWKRYEGDYLMTEANGYQTLLRVFLDDDRLMAAITDPADPSFFYRTELIQAYLDTFRLDSNADGSPDLDFTFCSRGGKPGFQMWMRNRQIVGERQLTPRAVRSRRP